jgi:hypothetical protein
VAPRLTNRYGMSDLDNRISGDGRYCLLVPFEIEKCPNTLFLCGASVVPVCCSMDELLYLTFRERSARWMFLERGYFAFLS